jgi:hypothetical protein
MKFRVAPWSKSYFLQSFGPRTLEFGRAAPYFLAGGGWEGADARLGHAFWAANFDGKKCHESSNLVLWAAEGVFGRYEIFWFESTGSTISKYRVPIAVFDYQQVIL